MERTQRMDLREGWFGGMGTEQGVEFTLREWEQVWAHTRHLETMRGQYLGFFFTAILGVAVFAGPRLVEDSLGAPHALLLLAAIVVGLELMTGFLYLAVTRVNVVLDYYVEMTLAMRLWMLGRGGAPLVAEFAFPPPARYRWAGTGGTAEWVLKASLVGFLGILIGVVARAVDVSGPSPTTWACASALALALGIAVLSIRGGVPGSGKY